MKRMMPVALAGVFFATAAFASTGHEGQRVNQTPTAITDTIPNQPETDTLPPAVEPQQEDTTAPEVQEPSKTEETTPPAMNPEEEDTTAPEIQEPSKTEETTPPATNPEKDTTDGWFK